jgi:serine/threonine protein kinase
VNLEDLTIDRYVLERLLGHGGMGDVYLAQDTTIHRQVAIKVFRSEISPYPNSESSRNSAELSRREMKAIAQLDHPHILPLYDYGEKIVHGTTLAYIVMPYREEGSLAQWLHQRTTTALLSSEDTLFLMRQAADALQHAHDHGIVHQDVKPSNFLIHQRKNAPGHPDLFLADFGIAKFVAATSATSHTIRGTPTYMAPEQWQGQSVPETDQYALAIMTYELLTGQTPFQGGMAQMMYQHLSVIPEAPSRVNADLTPLLDAVLLKALEKKPEERFPSITSFIEALKLALEGIDPHPFLQNARTVLPPVQLPPTDSQETDGTQTLDEEPHLTNDSLALFSEGEDEENIATQLSERSKDLPTIISAKLPALPPSDTLRAQNSPAFPLPYSPVALSSPGSGNPGSQPAYPYRRTIALLIVIAILVIAFGSVGLVLNARQVKSDRSVTAGTTTSVQDTAAPNLANMTSTAQAKVLLQMKNAVTSTATIHLQQTEQAQNTAQATATAQAQNSAQNSPTVVVIIATSIVPPTQPTPTLLPTPTSTPTPTLVPAPAPTITTDCAHLVTPWVAIYQYSHFGGRELCFEGKGLVNLATYGFDKQTDSINIAANGSFYDQANGQGAGLGFYYGDEQADLGTWDNRISSFVVTG